MALSGTINSPTYAGYYRLELDWTATQNVANNTSTITGKLYLHSLHSSAGINSSATKTGSVTIDGTAYSFSGSGLANLSGNQRKLITTKSRTVTHNSDGTKSVPLSSVFNIAVTLSGTYYSSFSLSGTAVLNTIPRASTMTTSASWTAGSNKSVTVSRSSTSFSHEVEVYVRRTDGFYDWVYRLVLPTSTTSGTLSFDTAENTEIFQHLAGRSSCQTQMIVQTFSGSTLIGENTYYGTLTAPNASITNSSFEHNVDVNDTITIGIERYNSSFTHTVLITLGSFTKTFTGVGSSTSWNPTTAEENSIYAQIGTDSSRAGTIQITTYYNGQIVRSATSASLIWHVPDSSSPIFSSSQISYDDTNSTTTTITGNNQYIIQNKSTFRARIISSATGQNGATISHYIITVNGVSQTVFSTGYYTFGTVSASSNITMMVKAVDNRGNSTTASKVVYIVPWSAPNVNTNANRTGFSSSTTLTLSGSVSPLYVAGVLKNSLISARYQYRERNTVSYTSLINFSTSTNLPNYSASNVTLTLDYSKAWDVRVVVTDRLGSKTIDMVVATGRPIFFVDSEMNALGFNDYPMTDNEFRINGRMVFGSNQYISASGAMGAIDLNNSDIVGLNGLFFRDESGAIGEGFNFIKNGAPINSTNYSDYDNFYIANGTGYLNGSPVMLEHNKLWEGSAYMMDTQTLYPSKTLSQCPNGWILCWSRFTGSVGNTDFNYTFVSKSHYNGGVWIPLVVTGTGATTPTLAWKYVYFYNDRIAGHSRNNTGNEAGQTLRYIASF